MIKTGSRIKCGMTIKEKSDTPFAFAPPFAILLRVKLRRASKVNSFVWEVQVGELSEEFAGFFVVCPCCIILIFEPSEVISF